MKIKTVTRDKNDRSGLLKNCADFLDVDLEKVVKKTLRASQKKPKKK